MVEFFEVIEKRRSIRKFKAAPVPKEDILKIIKAASMAPSGSNQQNWHFIVVIDKAAKEAMLAAVEQAINDLIVKINSKKAREEFVSYSRYFTFFSQAPAVIAVVEKPYDSLINRLLYRYGVKSRRRSTSGIQGVSAAVENLLLAACALGYGTCWMTGSLIAKSGLEKVLKINPPDELKVLIPIGVPDGTPSMPKRKPLDEIVTIV